MSDSFDLFAARAIHLLGMALVVLSLILGIYGILLLGWQCFTWLDTAAWHKLPLGLLFIHQSNLELSPHTPLQYIPAYSWEWLFAPTSLFGLHKVVVWFLDSISISFFAGIGVVAGLVIGNLVTAGQSETLRTLEQKAIEKVAKQYRIKKNLD